MQSIGDCRGLTLFLASDSQFSAFLQQPDEVVRQSVTAKLVALTQSNPDIDVVTLLDVNEPAMASNNDTVTGGFLSRGYPESRMLLVSLLGLPQVEQVRISLHQCMFVGSLLV